MARLPLTERECREILDLSKWITADFEWHEKPTNKRYAVSTLPVENREKKNLQVIVTVNVDLRSKFSMTLLLNNTHCIRSLDVNGSHTNKCSDGIRWNHQTHKHTWTDTCPGGHAYTPADIIGTTLEDVFHQFCTECKINFQGHYKPLTGNPLFPGM